MGIAERRHAHYLIDQLGPSELTAVVNLLQILTDPLSRKLAAAPADDEPESADERAAVQEADEWLKHNGPIPNAEVLADFDLTEDDFRKMAESPAEPSLKVRG